jgi:hypothetical protein
MFARDMFLREFDPEVLAHFEPDFVVIHCPQFTPSLRWTTPAARRSSS